MKLFIEENSSGVVSRRLTHRLKLKIIRPVKPSSDSSIADGFFFCEQNDIRDCLMRQSLPSMSMNTLTTKISRSSPSSASSLPLTYTSSKSCSSGEKGKKLRRKIKFNNNPTKEKKGLFFKGRWTETEHIAFVEGIVQYGKDWSELQNLIQTRSHKQIRSHAQKLFSKIQSDSKFSQKFKFKNKRISPEMIYIGAKSMEVEERDQLIRAILFIDYNDNSSQFSCESPNQSSSLLSSKRDKSPTSSGRELEMKSKNRVSSHSQLAIEATSDLGTDEVELNQQLYEIFQNAKQEVFEDCNSDFFVIKASSYNCNDLGNLPRKRFRFNVLTQGD